MLKRIIKNDIGLGDTIHRFTHWFDLRYGTAATAIPVSAALAYLGPWFYGTAIGSSAIGGAIAYWYRDRLAKKLNAAKALISEDQNGKYHIAAAVEWVAKSVFRLDYCGCEDRRQRLNSMVPYKKQALTIAIPGHQQPLHLGHQRHQARQQRLSQQQPHLRYHAWGIADTFAPARPNFWRKNAEANHQE